MDADTDMVEVLLVEDTPADAELALRALKKRGLANKVIWLKDGAEALDFLFARGTFADRAGANMPKVVLLDLKLPKLDGTEVLAAIRADSRTQVLPVVILTSSREGPDVRKCYELGVNSYIVKPVDFDAFVRAVADAGLYWLLLNQSPT